ncbi:uncharacterized protein LOC62_02G003369 [Vanrija pseudolonga]|uniref:Uncharacterized protein n=1 Tax=Vanrija pseudolonga TaxID=143232 RepID=A0AAF0Y8C2_9TREE|nr:hypothetical protein LOC62_02G003369 [Vanrija pseudolonga]
MTIIPEAPVVSINGTANDGIDSVTRATIQAKIIAAGHESLVASRLAKKAANTARKNMIKEDAANASLFNHESSGITHGDNEWNGNTPQELAFAQLANNHPGICANVKEAFCSHLHAVQAAAAITHRNLKKTGIDIFELERQAAAPGAVISADVMATIDKAFWSGFMEYRGKFKDAGGIRSRRLRLSEYYLSTLEFIWPILYPREMMAIDKKKKIPQKVLKIKMAVFNTKGAPWYRRTDVEIEVVGVPPPWKQGMRCDVSLRHHLCNLLMEHMKYRSQPAAQPAKQSIEQSDAQSDEHSDEHSVNPSGEHSANALGLYISDAAADVAGG